jgi:hypothetical protein
VRPLADPVRTSAILLEEARDGRGPLLGTRCPSCGRQRARFASAWAGRVEGGLIATVPCQRGSGVGGWNCWRLFEVAVRPVPDDGHPEHPVGTPVLGPDGDRVEMPEPPARWKPWWRQWARQRACRRMGGHWWHPADPMIAWACCVCGRETDGMPEDGR